jgi:hypothetical protein
LGPLPGTWWKVLRIASVAAFVAVVAAGCGGAARPQQSAFHGVPPRLAHDWEGQASAIAAAASAGDDCGAVRLADALRNQVLESEQRVPPRLRRPLVEAVNALANRLTCTVTTVQTVPPKPKPKPKPPPKHDHHGDHGPGHHKAGDGGGNDQ